MTVRGQDGHKLPGVPQGVLTAEVLVSHEDTQQVGAALDRRTHPLAVLVVADASTAQLYPLFGPLLSRHRVKRHMLEDDNRPVIGQLLD